MACDSNEKFHASHEASPSLLRVGSVVQGLITENDDQDGGETMQGS